jgi:hypothetical protein
VAETPVRPPAQAKPRRDAETHFEFQDDGLPTKEPRMVGRPRGQGHNNGLGLYKNNLYNEDGVEPAPGSEPRALGNITNLKDRRKDFESHFSMTDDSPHNSSTSLQSKTAAQQHISEDRQKAVRMMEASWGAYDESPVSQKENSRPGKNDADDHGINITGDGMGGKKGASGRGWAIGDESDEEQGAPAPRVVPGKKLGAQTQNTSSLWEF